MNHASLSNYFLVVFISLSAHWGSALADTRSDIVEAEDRFAAALASKSVVQLNQVLGEDFLYQHVTGRTFNRTEIVRIFNTGEITVSKFGPVRAELRDYGDTVISHGSRYFEGALKGQPYAGNLRFVNVWRKSTGGNWILVHRNSQLVN